MYIYIVLTLFACVTYSRTVVKENIYRLIHAKNIKSPSEKVLNDLWPRYNDNVNNRRT